MARPRMKRYRTFRRAYVDHRGADARERRIARICLAAALAAAVGVTLGLGLWSYERDPVARADTPPGPEAPASGSAGVSLPDSAAAPETASEEVLIN